MEKKIKVWLVSILGVCLLGAIVFLVICLLRGEQSGDRVIEEYQQSVHYEVMEETYDPSNQTAEVEVVMPDLQTIYEQVSLEMDLSSSSNEEFLQMIERQMTKYTKVARIQAEVLQTDGKYVLRTNKELKQLEYAQLDEWFLSVLAQEVGSVEITAGEEAK